MTTAATLSSVYAPSFTTLLPVPRSVASNNEEAKQFKVLPFFSPSVIYLIKKSGLLNEENKLTTSPAFPPCTQTQGNSLVDLLDSEFDLTDKTDGTKVLTGLTPRSILALMFCSPVFNKAQIFKFLVLRGGGLTKVIESDMQWVKDCINILLKDASDKDIDYSCIFPSIQAFPDRKLPDLDIHVMCKEKSRGSREGTVEQILESLGKQLVEKNPIYLSISIQKVKDVGVPVKNSNERTEIYKKRLELYSLVKDLEELPKDQCELVSIKMNMIAKLVIQLNCLNKFSQSGFATILSIGKLELVFTEDPGYLLTPDKLGMIFNFNIQKDLPSVLTLYPQDDSSKESVVHRAIKIACIDQKPTEHTFFKACTDITHGYKVNHDEQFDKALAIFVRYIYNHREQILSMEGKEYLERFTKNHLQYSIDEGLCILYHVLKYIQKSENKQIIPLIIKELIPFLIQPAHSPVLNIFRNALISYPEHFLNILKCLAIVPQLIPEADEDYFIIFYRDGILCPYIIEKCDFSQTIDVIKDENFIQAHTIISFLLDSNRTQFLATLSHENSLELLKMLKNPKCFFITFKLLLRCKEKSVQEELIKLIPEFYFNRSSKDLFLEEVLTYFEEPLLTAVQEFVKQTDDKTRDESKKNWMLILAKSHPKLTYELWEASSFTADRVFSNQLAHEIYSKSPFEALRIYNQTVNKIDSTLTLEIQSKVFDHIIKYASENTIETLKGSAVYEQLTIWLLQCLLQQHDFDKANTLITASKCFMKTLDVLCQTEINYWPLLTYEETVEHLESLNKKGIFTKALQGITYLTTQNLDEAKVFLVFETFLKINLGQSSNNEMDISNLLRAYLQFKANVRIPLTTLISFIQITQKLHNESNLIVFHFPLQALAVLFLEGDPEEVLSLQLYTTNYFAVLNGLLKDKTKPLEGCKELLNKLLATLIPRIKWNEDILVSLLNSLESSGLSFKEHPTVSSVKYNYALKNLDSKGSIDEKFKKLLIPTESMVNTQYVRNLNGFITTLLFENLFQRLREFITGINAFHPDFDFTSTTKQILEKINAIMELPRPPLKSSEKVIDLINILIDRNLLSESELNELISRFRVNLENHKKFSDNWEVFFNWMSQRKHLCSTLLIDLIQTVPKKSTQLLVDFLTQMLVTDQIKEPTFDRSTIEKFVPCLLKRLFLLKAPELLGLVKHRIELLAYVENTEERNNLSKQWLYLLTFILHDPSFVKKEDAQELFKFNLELEGILPSNEPDSLYWRYLTFFGTSCSHLHRFVAWTNLNKHIFLSYEQFPALLNNSVTTLISVTFMKNPSSIIVDQQTEDLILKISSFFRKAYKDSNPLLKAVPPLSWIKFLNSLNTVNTSLESVYWTWIYLSKTPNQSNEGHNICLSTIWQAYTELKDSKKVKELSVVVVALSKIHPSKSLVATWNDYLKTIVELMIAEPTAERIELFKSALGGLCNVKGEFGIANEYFPLIVQGLVLLAIKDDPRVCIQFWNKISELAFDSEKYLERTYYQNNIILTKPGAGIKIYKVGKEHNKVYSAFLLNAAAYVEASTKKYETSPEIKLFLYDWALFCMIEVLALNRTVKYSSPKAIKSVFVKCLDMVTRQDGRAFFRHITEVIPLLISGIAKCDIDYQMEPSYYEALARIGCPYTLMLEFFNNIVLQKPDFVKFMFSNQILETALEKIINEQKTPVKDLFANGYHLISICKIIEGRKLTGLSQWQRYLSMIADFLSDPIIEEKDMDYLHAFNSINIFIFKSRLKEEAKLLSEKEDANVSLKSFYTTVFECYLKMFPTLTFVKTLEIDCIDEIQQHVYGDFNEKYEKAMHKLLEGLNVTLNKFEDIVHFKTIKGHLDYFFLFTMSFSVELSADGITRRSNFVKNCLKQLSEKNTPIRKMIYTLITRLAVKHNILLESDILSIKPSG